MTARAGQVSPAGIPGSAAGSLQFVQAETQQNELTGRDSLQT